MRSLWGQRGLLFLAVILAIAVRLPSLGERSWWIDELITAQVAQRPLIGPDVWNPKMPPVRSLFGFTLQDTGPGPLTYLLEGALGKWARPHGGEFWIRLPGIFAAVLAVLLISRVGKFWWGGRAVATVTALWAAVFPPWVDFSTGARGYMWTVLCLLLHFAVLQDFLRKRALGAVCRGPRHARQLLLLSVVAFYISPINLVYCVPFWLAFLVAALRTPKAFSCVNLLGVLGVGSTLVVPYAALWQTRLRANAGALGSSDPLLVLARLRDFGNNLIIDEPWYAGLVLGAVVLTLFTWRLSTKRPMWRVARLSSVLVILAGVGVGTYLLTCFFLVPRYFVGYSVPLVWALGLAVQRAFLWSAKRWGKRRARALLGLGALVFAAIQVPSAIDYARTPVHNWLAAVRWLHERLGPNDIVFCGPNADIEVLWAYTQPLGWDEQVPRWLIVENGRRLDTASAEALKRALETPRRLWFVSPFLDRVRPPEYWKLIHDHFQPAARFPGRGEIHILVRPAGPNPLGPDQATR